MSSLTPCPSCQRHVREEECHCPFCAAPLAACSTYPRATAPRGIKRGALFAMGMSLAACSETNAVAIYGAPVTPGVPGGAGGGGAAGAGSAAPAGAAGLAGAGGSISGGSAGPVGDAGTNQAPDAAAPTDAGGDAGDP